MTIEFLLEDLSLGRWKEFKESLPVFAVFQMPSAQNKQNIPKLEYFAVAYPKLPHLSIPKYRVITNQEEI